METKQLWELERGEAFYVGAIRFTYLSTDGSCSKFADHEGNEGLVRCYSIVKRIDGRWVLQPRCSPDTSE